MAARAWDTVKTYDWKQQRRIYPIPWVSRWLYVREKPDTNRDTSGPTALTPCVRSFSPRTPYASPAVLNQPYSVKPSEG